MKQFKWWIKDNWRSLLLVGFFVLATFFVLVFQLGPLTGALSEPEVDYLNSVNGIGQVLREPAFLPHKILAFVAQSFSLSVTAVRLPSALLALLAVVTTVLYLRKYYSLRTVVLGGLIAVTSSWFLSIGRLAVPDISLVLWAPLFCFWHWLKQERRPSLAVIVFVLAVMMALYIPGFIWLIAAWLVVERRMIAQIAPNVTNLVKVCSVIIFIAFLVPLVRAVILDPAQILAIAGLPSSLEPLKSFPANFGATISSLLISSRQNAVFTVGRLPLLDVFSIVLLACGVYSLRYSKRRWQSLVGAGVLASLVFASFGGLVNSAVLMPVIYTLIIAGIGFLLTQWFTVFPYNPIARIVGTTLMTAGVLTIAFYHINRYFIAWPLTPETRKQFNQSLIE